MANPYQNVFGSLRDTAQIYSDAKRRKQQERQFGLSSIQDALSRLQQQQHERGMQQAGFGQEDAMARLQSSLDLAGRKEMLPFETEAQKSIRYGPEALDFEKELDELERGRMDLEHQHRLEQLGVELDNRLKLYNQERENEGLDRMDAQSAFEQVEGFLYVREGFPPPGQPVDPATFIQAAMADPELQNLDWESISGNPDAIKRAAYYLIYEDNKDRINDIVDSVASGFTTNPEQQRVFAARLKQLFLTTYKSGNELPQSKVVAGDQGTLRQGRGIVTVPIGTQFKIGIQVAKDILSGKYFEDAKDRNAVREITSALDTLSPLESTLGDWDRLLKGIQTLGDKDRSWRMSEKRKIKEYLDQGDVNSLAALVEEYSLILEGLTGQ